MRNEGGENGFSLLETLVALAVFGFVMVGAFTLFATNNKIWAQGQSATETHQNARIAIDRMARELRIAGYDLSGVMAGLAIPTGIQSANASSVTFVCDVDRNGMLDQVTYNLSGSRILRGVSTWNGTTFPAAVSNELANGVTSLSLSYYDGSDTALATPVAVGSLASVRRISVSLNCSATTGTQTAATPLVSDVRLRN